MTDSTKDLRTCMKENTEAVGRGEADDSIFCIWKDNPAVEDVREFIDEIRGRRSGTVDREATRS